MVQFGNLLQELPLLRVLSLSNLSISEVPEFIGSLKHLRYLNLSRTDIKLLPENVCNLYNLQTLILFGCKSLINLPNSFLKLKNLRHLDIRDTPGLKKMPLGIGELKGLQTLSKIIIGGENGFAITELKNLQNLHGKISIWGLGNVQNAMEACDAHLTQKRLSELELDWGYGLLQKRLRLCHSDTGLNVFRKETHDKEVLTELKPQTDSLKKLEIVSYAGIKFPNWVGDPSFLGLTHVSIYGCEECTSLPELGQLPSLKDLYIGKMSNVKIVGWELLGTGVAFLSLEILAFDSMPSWEVWSTNNNGVVDAFGFDLKIPNIEKPQPPQSSIEGGQVASTLSAVISDKEQEKLHVSPKEVQSKQTTCTTTTTTRSRTKVQMQGIAVGRAVDLTVLKGYNELIDELEEMFEIKGELRPRNQWEIVFTDDEGDMMLMGDDPWPEFCNMVKRILICSSQDVKKMRAGSYKQQQQIENEEAIEK